MRSAMRTAHRARLAAILALGAFALHQLRYLIAFGSSSSEELARQGHGYMADALPVLGVFALSALVATLIRGRYGAGMAQRSFARRALILAVALFAVYASQESLEGIMAAGHPGGVAALLATGGWLAIPLALAFGALSALVIRLLEGVEVAIARRPAARLHYRAPHTLGQHRPGRAFRLALTPLAFGLARRPPPPIPA
jgi:hypothetical protein